MGKKKKTGCSRQKALRQQIRCLGLLCFSIILLVWLVLKWKKEQNDRISQFFYLKRKIQAKFDDA